MAPRSKEKFASVLDMEVEKAERPKPAPVGTYLFKIEGQARIDKTPERDGKPATDFAEFTCQFIQPDEDVSQEELDEWSIKSSNGNPKTTRLTFYFTEDSLYRFKDFCRHCDVETPGKNVRQLLAELPGRMFKGRIAHRTFTDKNNEAQIAANISNTSAA